VVFVLVDGAALVLELIGFQEQLDGVDIRGDRLRRPGVSAPRGRGGLRAQPRSARASDDLLERLALT
jgi:hypothetical protein